MMRVKSQSSLQDEVSAEIAVVIPFRGQLEELADAVESVRLSTMQEFRILVIDDRPGEVSFPNFLHHDEYLRSYGQGLSKVIELSKLHLEEKYVALLAGDDLMSPSRLQLQFEEIQKLNSEICLSGMRKFSSVHKEIEMLTGIPKIKTFTKMWLLLGAYGADGTIFMTSDFYRDKYVLDPTDSYSDWTLALANYPREIAYVAEDLVFYRQHANQTTRNQRNSFLESGVYPAWSEVYEEFFGSKPSIEVFLILGAPWFRKKIQPKNIRESSFYSAQILSRFRSEGFTLAEINSVESLIIRRYLFRTSPRNIISIISVLYSQEINHPFSRLILEASKVTKAAFLQRDIKPRTVKV